MAAVSPSVAAAATNTANTATAATGPVRPGDVATAPCQAPSANNKPIRPNALMNFSTSMLAAAPTTRLRPPPPSAAGSNCGFESAPARGAGRQGRQGQLISASQAHQSQQQQQQPSQQSPKALSPSGGLNDSLPSQILPHLYVGNQEQTNRDTLSKLNIKYILSLGLLPQLLQSGACTASISPSSPGKMAPTGTAPTSTGPANGTSKQNSGTNNIASSTPSSRATSATSHLNPQQQQQQQQQQILMPERDSSRDFKIRLRPLTPTKPSASSTTATASPSEHHIYQHYRYQRAAANQERVGCTQAHMAEGAKHELASGNGAYEAQFAAAAAAAAAATDDDENKRVKQLRSIHCKCINITDSSEQSLMSFFDEAFAFIDEARRRKCNILIHCLAGISRSPTIAIAYLMRVKSLHWREAYDLVKKSRPQIDPNLNFMGQLRIYNKSLRAAHRGPHELDERRVNY